MYTPAVGEACQRYHALPLTPRGLYLRATDAGRFLERLRAWPRQDIRCVGATCEVCLDTTLLCQPGVGVGLLPGGQEQALLPTCCLLAADGVLRAPERRPTFPATLLLGWWW